jgi:phage FluMu gp28-like protein
MANKKITVKLPEPTAYQKEILGWVNEDEVKFITFIGSRQTGKSFLMKMICTIWGLGTDVKKIGYITPTLKLSKLFFKELCESLKPFIINSNATDLIITFKGGTTLQFFSAESEDTLRGFQFTHLIIDEAAFIKNDTFNYVIRPTVMIKGVKIVLCSTPNGNQGFFYDHYNLGLNGENGYRTKAITIYDNPFISTEEIEVIKSQVPEKVFRQEYLAEFNDGSGTVFSNYRNCIDDNPKRTGNYFIGCDWAKQNDYTVFTVINDLQQVVEIVRINGMDYTKQVDIAVELFKKYNPKKIISEENNIGTVVNELIRQKYSSKNFETETLTNSSKREMIENLVVGFENNKVTIPNNEILLRELQAFSATYNHQTQTIKYSAPNGLHDDMVISLAYAYKASTKKIYKANVSFL